MTKQSGKHRGVGFHMLRGSAWMIALRWAMRLIGVISTIILARILTPRDFGIVAVAMIVVGLFEMLTLTGQAVAIVRHEAPTHEHYDSAWTISLILGIVVALCILIAAPFTKAYFHEPRAVLVMQILALRAFLGGLENIGTVDFSRELRFDRFFVYNVCTKLLQFCLTVVLAFTWRNYWALVAGILMGQVSRTVLSYVMSPYRPRLSLARAREIWGFSVWTFVRAIGGYFQTQVDNIAIGGIVGAAVMGRYTVAKDIAASPTQEIMNPMVAALLPVMSKYRANADELRALYSRMLGWSAIICASTGVGVTMVADDLVRVVLGPKWVDATELIGWLALNASVAALLSGTSTLLDVLGMPFVSARILWSRLIVFTAVVFAVAYSTHDVVSVVITRLVVTTLFVPTIVAAVRRKTGVPGRDYLRAMWRPFVAAGFMAAAIWTLNRVLPFQGAPRLVLDVLAGAATYVAVVLGLWDLSGRPKSAEQDILTILSKVQTKLARFGKLAQAAD